MLHVEVIICKIRIGVKVKWENGVMKKKRIPDEKHFCRNSNYPMDEDTNTKYTAVHGTIVLRIRCTSGCILSHVQPVLV